MGKIMEGEAKERVLRSLREFYPLKVDEAVLISAVQKNGAHATVEQIMEVIYSLRDEGWVEGSIVRAPFGSKSAHRFKITDLGIEHLTSMGDGEARDLSLPLAEIESRLVETYDQIRTDMARLRTDLEERNKELEAAIKILSKDSTDQSHEIAKLRGALEAYEDRVASEETREEKLVLRILTGDERTIYQAILESDGKILQKDLIVRCKMSNAKVSRTLDRLEGRGILSRERHGATNRIRLIVRSPEPGGVGEHRPLN